MRLLTVTLCFTLLITGCGGGGATTPVNPDPLVQVTGIRPSQGLGTDTPGYAGDELSIQALLTGEVPTSIVWDFGGGAIPVSLDDPDMPTVELGLPGHYTGRVTVTDSAGNSDSFDFDFTIVPESHRIQSITPVSPAGFVTEPVQFSAQLDGEAEVIAWDFAGGVSLETSLDSSPLVQLTEIGTHEVTLTVTFKAGPTVSRSFPFTVASHPWQELRREPIATLIEACVLSTGEMAVLLLPSQEREVRRLELLRIAPGDERHPDRWDRHPVGLPGALSSADLAEHAGRLGVMYMTQTGSGYGEGGADDFRRIMAVSTDLRPVAATDWTVAQVSPYVERGAVALAAGSGPGWQALIASREQVFWAATSAMVPAESDWVMGEFVGSYQTTPSLFLTNTGSALVCSASDQTHIDVRVGQPANFPQVMSAEVYPLPGHVAQFNARDGRIVALIDRSNIMLTTNPAPVQPSDWTVLVEGVATGERFQNVALGADTMFALEARSVEIDTFQSLSILHLRSRPVDLSGEWTEQIVQVDNWHEAGIIPLASPIVVFRSAGADELVWAQLTVAQ